MPRIGYLFSQNPTISASLPNYAETRALLGSHLIDSGSLDYSVEEPLSLPAAVVSGSRGHQHPSSGPYNYGWQQQQRHWQPHHHHRQPAMAATATARDRHAPTGMEASAGRTGSTGSSQLNSMSLYAASSSTSNAWNMRGRLGGGGSGATTAELSLSPSSSTSFCLSSNASGPLGANPITTSEAVSRHSALQSMNSSSIPVGPDRYRIRPVFQKSSSTPTARGTCDQRQQSLSPISRMQARHKHQHEPISMGGDSLHQAGAHQKPTSRQTSFSGSYLGVSGQMARPMKYPQVDIEPPVDEYGSETLSRMMENLGRSQEEIQYYQQQQQLQCRQQQQQQQLLQQQRRMLPQIPRLYSPSELHPSFLATGGPTDSSHYVAQAEVVPQHRRRRQSSLELERQRMQLGLPDFEAYPDGGYHHQLAYDDRLTAQAPHHPPTISVSPEFPDNELELDYLHKTGIYDPSQQPSSQRQLEQIRLANFQEDQAFRQAKQHHQQIQQYYAPQVHHSATHHPSFQHHHHSIGSRSMAMGSDSELNTRSLSSNKLYYVHVPPARRSHRHQRQHTSGGSHHRHRSEIDSAAATAAAPPQMVQQQHHHQRQLRLVDNDDTIPMEAYNPVRNRDKLAADFVTDPMNPPAFMRVAGQHVPGTAHHSHPAVHLPDYAMAFASNVRPNQSIVGHSTVTLPPEMLVRDQQVPQRQSKGVTFDGRTSAPVYGRRKRETREKYLRTNSEEYGAGDAGRIEPSGQRIDTRQRARQPSGQHSGAEESEDNEDRSSSIASRTSNASYTGSIDQQGRHHAGRRSQRSAITASEFNITGTGPSLASDSWVGSQQQQQQQSAYPAAGSKEHRVGRGPEFPMGQTTGEPVPVPRHGSGDGAKRRSRHSSTFLESESVSDTGGAASISDKEAGSSQATALGGSTGTPPSNRSDRRARVRDNQQSSNERSIGDAAGSSQSLKSQMGPGTSSGGLSKKSNSTTQLSLTGKF